MKLKATWAQQSAGLQRHRYHRWVGPLDPRSRRVKSLQLCFACYLGHAATLPLTVLFLPTAKLPSKLFSSKFRTWLLHPVVSRQNLKFIAGYTLHALR